MNRQMHWMKRQCSLYIIIYKIIREEKSRGATIIVATHHKEDLKEVCDVILKIAEGKIVEENENK